VLQAPAADAAAAMKHFDTDDVILMVMQEQNAGYQRGVMSVWTIYRAPLDWPHGYIVRKFEVNRGISKPTNFLLQGESLDDNVLVLLRHILKRAGLVCRPRSPQDDVKIVESWL